MLRKVLPGGNNASDDKTSPSAYDAEQVADVSPPRARLTGATEGAQMPLAPLMPGPGASLRFLVVDDDAEIRDLVVRMIEHCGHSADRACDGLEAIEAIAGHIYDVVLLDLTMPRMTGEEVMRWLQQHPAWARGLRIFMVTALANDHRDRLLALGAHAVLSKPLRLQQLRDIILGSESVHVGGG